MKAASGNLTFTSVCRVGLALLFICLSQMGCSHASFDGEGKADITPLEAAPQKTGEFTIKFAVGEHGIKTGGAIKTAFPRRWRPQTKHPGKDGFLKVTVSRDESDFGLTLKNRDPSLNGKPEQLIDVITVTITKKPLVRGDTITISYLKKSPKITPAYRKDMVIATDVDGDGEFAYIKDFPKLSIRSGPQDKIYAIAPTTQQTGIQFHLKVAILDKSYNPVTDYTGTIEFTSSDDKAKLPGSYIFSAGDGGVKKFPITMNTPGYHTITVSDKTLYATSNRIECKTADIGERIWWGDIHSHSEISPDGIGNGVFKYARDVACLDFYSLTDHYPRINKKGWDYTKQKTIEFNKPGEFVTILGYECSFSSPSGHNNVYFNCSDDIIPKIPMFRWHELQMLNEKEPNILMLWEYIERELPPAVDAITIPHHTGIVWAKRSTSQRASVNFDKPYQDPKKRVAIEIFSKHGSSEMYDRKSPLSYQNWSHPAKGARKKRNLKRHFSNNGPHYAQDAWAKKLYLGVIASTDDHESHPGMPGRSTVYNPLIAVYAKSLTRDSIFNAIKTRRTYATTGERIILNFTLNSHPMGSRVELEKGKYPKISVLARGTDLIDFVEVLKWDFITGKYDKDGHPIFEAIVHKIVRAPEANIEFVDEDYNAFSMYYVRLKQLKTKTDNEAWAWSSPIWVNKS